MYKYLQPEYAEFLDDLRESGVTNMFGAAPYLVEKFKELDINTAEKILKEWMEAF